MAEKTEPKSNYDRLIKHLDEHSLAARLVRAHNDRNPAHPSESIKAVLLERLEQVIKEIDNPQT